MYLRPTGPPTKDSEMRLRKSSEYGMTRYYLVIDGVDVGWVLKTRDGTWNAYLSIESPFEGTQVATGEPTRRWAIVDALVALGRTSRHVFSFDTENGRVERLISAASIRAALEALR